MRQRAHPFAISRKAVAELAETIEYIRRDSPENAGDVAEAIGQKIAQLVRFPESAPRDTEALRGLPGDAKARMVHTSGFVIRYLYPFRRGGRDVVYIVSIQRGGRLPPDDADYTERLLKEVAGLYVRGQPFAA